MSAAAERRPLTAYALYEGLMRAVSAEDAAEAMDIQGSEALTPQLLLDGQEPTREEEELWFQERSRCGPCCVWHAYFCEIRQVHLPHYGGVCRI